MSKLKNLFKVGQRGAVMVFFALSLPVLIGFTGLAVDVGNVLYQKNKLQNATDAAALAGAKNLNLKDLQQLIDPNDTPLDADFYEESQKISSAEKTELKTKVDGAGGVSNQYLVMNMGEGINNPNVNLKVYVPPEVNKDTSYYYVVNSTMNVPTFFISAFGNLVGNDDWKTWPVSAVSEVRLGNSDALTVEEMINQVSADMFKTIPNFYWQSIVSKYGGTLKSTVTKNNNDKYYKGELSKEYHTLAFDDNVQISFPTKYDSTQQYQQRFALDHWTDMDGTTIMTNLMFKDVGAGWISGFRNPDTNLTTDGYFASNKFAAPIVGRDNGLSFQEYKFKDEITYYEEGNPDPITSKSYENIKGVFIDAQTLSNRRNVRAILLTLDDVADNAIGTTQNPFFMRFESEPARLSSGDYHLVLAHIINVTKTTTRPVVISYDGPRPERTQDDAPKINGYPPGETSGTISAQDTSVLASAPFELYLEKDFKGVIFAPNSHVFLKGEGKIHGFVLAQKISYVDRKPTNLRQTVGKISIPYWQISREKVKAYKDGLSKWYNVETDYAKTTITGSYEIAYDVYENYTYADN